MLDTILSAAAQDSLPRFGADLYSRRGTEAVGSVVWWPRTRRADPMTGLTTVIVPVDRPFPLRQMEQPVASVGFWPGSEQAGDSNPSWTGSATRPPLQATHFRRRIWAKGSPEQRRAFLSSLEVLYPHSSRMIGPLPCHRDTIGRRVPYWLRLNMTSIRPSHGAASPSNSRPAYQGCYVPRLLVRTLLINFNIT